MSKYGMQGVHIGELIGSLIGSCGDDRHLFVANKVRKFPKKAI